MDPLTPTRRKPLYLSPSALKCYEKSPDEYYLRYLALSRPPKEAQTKPMAAGSAFDAYIKASLHYKLFGANHVESNKYTVDALIEAQVESHNHDWARKAGNYLYLRYVELGCEADLLTMLATSAVDPKFEFSVQGTITTPHGLEREGMSRVTNGVPLLGKPDVFMMTSGGYPIIHDFKVNGYCSQYNTSPLAGYVKIRPGGYQHKEAFLSIYRGLMIDASCFFETRNVDWAEQLATYGWLLGQPVGAEFAVSVDQLVCKGGSPDGEAFPEIRVAYHRSRVSEQMQYGLLNRFMTLWALIVEEPFHFFRDVDLATSQGRCGLLDRQAVTLYGGLLTEDEQWLVESSRSNTGWS